MARGKHAARSENRDWEALQNRLLKLEGELAVKKKALHDLQKDWLRLKSIEKLFDEKADVIKELQGVTAELDKANGQLLVHIERERRWARLMMDSANDEFLKINRDLLADLVELGYVPERLRETRTQRRNLKTRKSTETIWNAHREVEKANG